MRRGEVDGCWGWMIVAAAALNRIVIYGISYSAGVVYVVILEVFNEGSGITSWISSLITAVLFFTLVHDKYDGIRFDKVHYLGT
ncbi:unnamed protein product [Mytilus coruscus]|uniref:Uncharacterized protein n=1 Tax=Mytilus coruscus TaxID=42192 RepID=A0A6J8EXU3_MYTCO|nr:unnamed protein product [Mytilus coruscus]